MSLSVGGAQVAPSLDTAALRQGASLVDRSRDLALLSFRGRDSQAFLQRMLSNDVARVDVGRGVPAALLTSKSQVVCTLEVLRSDDALLAIVPGPAAAACVEALDRFIIADDVELEHRSVACLGVVGPEAAALGPLASLAPLLADDAEALSHLSGRVCDVEVFAVADDGLGIPGVLLFVASDELETLRGGLRATGAEEQDASLVEVARVEAGVPRFGADLSEENLLLEGGQLSRVSFDKGCYIGQEPVCRIHNRGQVNRRLVGLRWLADDGDVPVAGATLSHPDKAEAGAVTSVARSVAAGGIIGLGYVHRKVMTPGTRLSLDGGGEVEIVALPHVPVDRVPRTFPRYKDQD